MQILLLIRSIPKNAITSVLSVDSSMLKFEAMFCKL
jgi:hypothetical protein